MEIKLVILFLYFLILFFIGWQSSKRIKDIKDYYVGGKKLGFWVVAFSTRATGESAWLLLGLTGLGAMVGVSAFWVVLGEVLGGKVVKSKPAEIGIMDINFSKEKNKDNKKKSSWCFRNFF